MIEHSIYYIKTDTLDLSGNCYTETDAPDQSGNSYPATADCAIKPNISNVSNYTVTIITQTDILVNNVNTLQSNKPLSVSKLETNKLLLSQTTNSCFANKPSRSIAVL